MDDSAVFSTDLAILDTYSDSIAWTDGRDGRIAYLIHDNPIGLSIARYGDWSGIELDYHLHFIAEDAVVLDVGANVGVHSLAYATKATAGRVLLFEPQPLLLAMALKTLEANGRTNVQGYRAAVSNKAGPAMFRFPDYGSLGNYGMVKEVVEGEATVDLTPVPTLAIDSLDLERCDFIKIDAEGASVEVLQSAAQTIRRCLPIVATEVLGVEDGWRIMEWFRALDCGYTARFYRFSNYNARNCRGDQVNFFGVAEECGLLFLPPGQDDGFTAEGLYTSTIRTLDELAREHQRTARYGDFTPFDRKHEVIGALYVDLLRRMLPVFATSTRTDVCVGDEGWGGVQSAIIAWDQRIPRIDKADSAGQWDMELREREAAVARALDDIARRSTELQAAADGHQQAVADFEARRKELELAWAQHELATAELGHQRAIIDARNEEVVHHEKRLAKDAETLSERLSALMLREGDLTRKEEQLLRRERELDGVAQSLASKSDELNLHMQMQAAERARLSDKAMELESLQARLQVTSQFSG